MTVIAMTREMGSLGKDVAAGVAKELELEVVHHGIVERDLASKLAVDESDVHRFLESTPSLLARWKIDKDRLASYTAEEVLDLATRGDVVIRGWGATELLKRVTHVLRVRICAPMDVRVRVLQERLGVNDQKAARQEIERNDAAHARALGKLGVDRWDSASNYDMVLNTERVPIEQCVSQVVAMCRSDSFQPTAASRQALADLGIERRVRTLLDSAKGHADIKRLVELVVDDGHVVLSGTAESVQAGQALCHTIRSVPGVRSITNNLFVPRMDSSYRPT